MAGHSGQGRAGIDRPADRPIRDKRQSRSLLLPNERREAADMSGREGTSIDEKPSSSRLGCRHIAARGDVSLARSACK